MRNTHQAIREDPSVAPGWIVLSILDRLAGRLPDAADKVRRAGSCVGASSREDGAIRFFKNFGRDNRAAALHRLNAAAKLDP